MTVNLELNQQQLWQHIFKDEQLMIRLIKDNTAGSTKASIDPLKESADENAVTIESSKWGAIKLKIWPATALGDNFMSDAYNASAKLNGGKLECRAFIKVLPHNNLMFLSAKAMKSYHRETAVYQELHSILRQIKANAGVRDDEIPICAPDFYHSHLDEAGENGTNRTMVVMQDLKQLGFRMVDKKGGCTMEEAKLALTTLANYHALTIAFVRSIRNPVDNKSLVMPEKLQVFHEGYIFLEKSFEMLGVSIPVIVGLLETLNHKEAAAFLDEQYTKNGRKILAAPTLEECGPLACILHGDCWNNNMMYRYDDKGKVVEMKLVDWQIPRVDHPGTDILYFLVTSTSPEIWKKHRRPLLNHYYDVLSSAMEKLGLELYSREIFFKEIHARMRWAMFFGLIMYPSMFNEKTVVEFEEKDASTEEADKKKTLDMDEIIKALEDTYDVNEFLSNKLLCDRIVDLVETVRYAVKNDNWSFSH